MLNVMENTITRVVILASSEKMQQRLSDLLEDAGLIVAACDTPSDNFRSLLETVSADVLLVDLSEANDSETDIIDTLLDYDELPIFFNDSSPAGGATNALWAKKLARKLAAIVSKHAPVSLPEAKKEIPLKGPPETDSINTAQIAKPTAIFSEEVMTIAESADATPTEALAPTAFQKPEGAAVNFWLLGASLGGPQAVRQFLAAIKGDLPVAFILAQHIGANHISLLAEQLDRVTPFKVVPGRSGYLLRHHEVVLAPSDKTINITEDGYLSLSPPPEDSIYSPSIDNAITTIAKHYGRMAGAIIFSGMGDDGARGCIDMAAHGGVVWAQDVDSCVISSMPDQARKTNTVTYSANPQKLADQLYRYYSDSAA
jgi:chemosensory pili system protein ChpB (putative protein-glutamate methylesterase)